MPLHHLLRTKVFCLRFLAEDPNSGRREYFISRDTLLDLTDLTVSSVRASDPRIVSVTGTTLQGHNPGSADIQVIIIVMIIIVVTVA